METDFKKFKVLSKRNLILLGIVLILGIFSVSYGLKEEIVIQDGNKELLLKGYFSNVEEVLKKGNIILNKNDQLSMDLAEEVKDGMKITIKRAYPVTILVDGEKVEAMTAYSKVRDVLSEYDISLGESDIIEPSLDAEIDRSATISIKRLKEEIIVEERVVPYERVIKYNDDLDKGKLMVIQRGKDGKKEVEYKVTYEDGVEITREIMDERLVLEAQNEIVEQGTAQYVATSRGNLRYSKSIKMTSTAYDAGFESTGKNPGDPGYGITRSGTKVRPGVVAVDPKVIPLGTKLYIKSLDNSKDYGFASAEDTGGAIKGNKIDLFFEDPEDVKKYGRRKVEVYILK